jgi:hypothetical protein
LDLSVWKSSLSFVVYKAYAFFQHRMEEKLRKKLLKEGIERDVIATLEEQKVLNTEIVFFLHNWFLLAIH